MITIYQTIQDTGNPDKIEQDGPIFCSANDAWLGKGYYFWESNISNAHWWGKEHLRGNYIICSANYEKDSNCFDLIDNPIHRKLMEGAIDEMQDKGLYINGQTTVARIISFLRGIGVFKFSSTRAYAIGCRRANSDYDNRIKFNQNNIAYLDLRPLYQICFYTKTVINDYKIVYPDYYVDGYVI